MLRYLFPCVFLAAMAIAGCGGGGTGTMTPPTSSPSPSASISPGATPQSVTLSGAGYQLQFTLPGIFAGGGSLIATLQASPPSGVPVPALKSRSTAKTPDKVGSTVTSLVYLVVQASGTVQFTSVPSFVFTLPGTASIPSGSPSYVAFYDPTQQTANSGWIGVLGPGVISGQTDTFAGVNSGVTLVGGNTYVYALVYTSQAVPTATPAPTPTAEPSAGPTPTNAPTPTGVAGTIALTITNSNTAITSSNINVYIYGQSPTGSNPFMGVNANGSTYAIPSVGATVAPIAWSGGGGNSETVYLPALIGARVYVVDGNSLNSIFTVQQAGAGPTALAPWSNDGSQSVYFDDFEYAWNGGSNGINFDVSQTDVIGLALAVTANSPTGAQTIGLKSGAITALESAVNALPQPWPSLVLAGNKHVINPQHGSAAFINYGTSGASVGFLDSAIMTAWNTYANGNWMTISAASLSATTYPGALYGTVDASGNFDFYETQSIAGTLAGTIANPQTYASGHSTTVTTEMFAQNGAFGDFTTPSTTYPTLGPAIGNRVSGALNSGVFATAAQPQCSGRFPGATAAPYENQFAGTLHSIANTYAYVAGAAYGYPYDDLCGTSTDTTGTGVTSMTLTINPS